MPVTVKVNYKGAFHCQHIASNSSDDVFQELMKKVHEIKNKFQGSLAWKDSAGDLMVLASPADIAVALQQLQPGKPLYVFMLKTQKNSLFGKLAVLFLGGAAAAAGTLAVNEISDDI